MPFNIIRADITALKADAIVNAANTNLAQGGGVCGAIFNAAGADKLQAACDKLSPIKTGEAVITPGYKLPAKYVIHAAGPVYRGGCHGEEALLRAAYTNSLERAAENKCASVAFPLISSGIYGYPKADALRVATAAISDFLAGHDIEVTLVVFDRTAFTVGTDLLGAVGSYIDKHYVDEHTDISRMSKLITVEREAFEEAVAPDRAFESAMQALQTAKPKRPQAAPRIDDLAGSKEPGALKNANASKSFSAAFSLEERKFRLDEPFAAALFRLIDEAGKTDPEIYKRANLDRRLFSKIRSNKHYAPSKPTVLALAVALRLNLEQTGDLLERAGFALSHSRKFDVIVEFFIANGKYDIFEINNVLFEYDQPILGG